MLPHLLLAGAIRPAAPKGFVRSILSASGEASNIGFVKKRYLMRMVRRTSLHVVTWWDKLLQFGMPPREFGSDDRRGTGMRQPKSKLSVARAYRLPPGHDRSHASRLKVGGTLPLRRRAPYSPARSV
jgi:hypothetical protein